MRVLVTGATGYIGSLLAPALLNAGEEVFVAVRSPEKLAALDWSDQAGAVRMDLLDAGSVRRALRRVSPPEARLDVAYYLVHALGEGDYPALDERAASTFAAEAAAAGVRRIVYLGGFMPAGEVSQHLRSRARVGELLAAGGVDTVALQAAAILGAGSTPFEIIRDLVDRLYVVPLPAFMRQQVQPIAIDDVLYYLAAAADRDRLAAGRYDISGDRFTTYVGLARTYASAAGLRRVFVPVPLVPPGGAAALVGPMTRVASGLVADLMESLSSSMVSSDRRIRDSIADPLGGLIGIPEGMTRAVWATRR